MYTSGCTGTTWNRAEQRRYNMAGRQSTIQASPHLRAIESAILDGVSVRQIASRYNVSPNAVHRHAQGVVRPALANAQVAISKANDDGSVDKQEPSKAEQIALIRQSGVAPILERRVKDFDRIIGKAEESGEFGACASLINSETTRLRLLAELSGELQPQSTQTTAIVLLMPQQPTQGQPMQADAIDAEWSPG